MRRQSSEQHPQERSQTAAGPRPRLSVPVSAGPLVGELSWWVEACTFTANLDFEFDFEPEQRLSAISVGDLRRPWSQSSAGHHADDPLFSGTGDAVIEVGFRAGEFVTIDGLLNQLGLLGVSLDAESVEAAATLRSRATAIFGDVELVGIADERGGRLYSVFPDLRMIALQPEVALRPFRFGWGGVSAIATDTARSLIARVCSRRWGPDEEMLAQALVYNFLSEAGPAFSLNANSLSDWCLLDGELATELGPAELLRLRAYESRQ